MLQQLLSFVEGDDPLRPAPASGVHPAVNAGEVFADDTRDNTGATEPSDDGVCGFVLHEQQFATTAKTRQEKFAKFSIGGVCGLRNNRHMKMHEWVSDQLARKGRGARVALAERLGINPSQVTRIASGERPIALREIPILQSFFGELPPVGADNEPVYVPIDEAERVSANGDDGAPAFYAGRYAPRLPGGIPEIDGATGAGEGVDGEIVAFAVGPEIYSAHRVVEEWVIPPSALDGQLGLTQSRTIVMRVTGDSMEPTYPAGQRVFVDIHQTTLTVDAVYIISDGESAPKIKRLQRVPASSPAMVRIISDNPLFPTDTVPLDKIRIHGRVAGALVPR